MTQGQQQIIIEITQSVIAVMIVAGLGFAILSGNSHVNDVLPVLMAVVGFYFGRQVPTINPTTPPIVAAATNAAQTATNAAQTATAAAAVATNAAQVVAGSKTTGEVPAVGDSKAV